MASPDRPARPQYELTVVSTERVGPHLVRVVLTGDSLADFGAAEHTDAYVKLRFTDADGDGIPDTSDPDADGEGVADPYYGGPEGFTATREQIEAAAGGIIDWVREQLG